MFEGVGLSALFPLLLVFAPLVFAVFLLLVVLVVGVLTYLLASNVYNFF